MELHHSVAGFFHDAVTDALRARQVDAAEPTEFYLVNLLSEYAQKTPLDDEPLALKMAQATGAAPEARARVLKEVGDTSLYVSGFFADSLARRLIDVEYYISIGGSAYAQLAGHNLAGAFREVYDELADKFARFVDVLQEVRANTNVAGGGNLIRLYEAWIKTGSEWLEKRLRASGVFAVDAFGKSRLPQ